MGVPPPRELRFADNAAALRQARRMSQETLGRAAGMTRVSWAEVESGLRRVRLDEAYLAAEALGVPLDKLVGEAPLTIPLGRMVTRVPDPQAEWWTTAEVAAYLGLGTATVSSYVRTGRMPRPDLPGGRTHRWRPPTIIE